MIDLQSAVESAKSAFGTLLQGRDYSDLALEEVELDDAGDHWLITLGYTLPVDPDDAPLRLSSVLAGSPKKVRNYKAFKINAESGDVVSMKIRNPWAELSKS